MQDLVSPTGPRYLRGKATVGADDPHHHATRAALIGGGMALGAVSLTLAAVLLSLLLGVALFTGFEVRAAFAMVAVVLMVFFAFVFQRLFRLKAEASREKGAIDLDIGRRD